MKILVAEDDKFLANAYNMKFSKEGYEVKTASNGQEVLNILQKYTPDVVLLDIVMPVMDGFAVLREMQKNENWKKIPVVISSNLGQKEDIEQGMSLGATDYLIKSNNSLDDIIKKLTKIAQTE